MNNPYVRLIVILGIPLLIGLGVGYAVRPSGIEPAHAQEHTAAQILPAAPAQQEKPAQTSDDIAVSRQNSITRAVFKISPTVVGINVIAVQQVQYRDPFSQYFDDPFFKQFFGYRTFKQDVK